MNTFGQNLKDALQEVEQILGIFDLDLWPQDHIGALKSSW